MADLARAEARAKEEGPRKSEAEEERSGGSEEGGTRRGTRAEAKEERGEGGEGATRSYLDLQNTCFYERDLCKTFVWLRFPSEKVAKPWLWRPRSVKSTCFASPKCFPGTSLRLLGAPGGPLGGPVGQTGPSGGTQDLQTRSVEAYMCVLYGPADVFKHVGT